MRALVSVGLASLLLTVPHVSLAQDQAIVGVWQVKSLVTKEVASGKTVRPFGERMSGYHVYSKGGHFMTLNVGPDRKPPATANPTDAERLELQRTAAWTSGTYRIEGDKLINRYDTSWHQARTGTERAVTFTIDGKTLTTTTPPFKGSLTGSKVVAIATAERVE